MRKNMILPIAVYLLITTLSTYFLASFIISPTSASPEKALNVTVWPSKLFRCQNLEIKIVVRDVDNNPVEGATVFVDGDNKTTPASGVVSFWRHMQPGQAPPVITVMKTGYNTVGGTIPVEDEKDKHYETALKTGLKLLEMINQARSGNATKERFSIPKSDILTFSANISLPTGENMTLDLTDIEFDPIIELAMNSSKIPALIEFNITYVNITMSSFTEMLNPSARSYGYVNDTSGEVWGEISCIPSGHFPLWSYFYGNFNWATNTTNIVGAGSFEVPVGGVWVPVDKLALLAPYIALASTIIVATAATAIYVKHAKRRKKKQ